MRRQLPARKTHDLLLESRTSPHSTSQGHHTLTPLRSLTAIAPSGTHIYLTKYSESDREVSFGCGNLTAVEFQVFWRAKLAAERPGVEMWEKAEGILTSAGWQLV